MDGASFVQGLFESIQDEANMSCPAHPPADDATGIGVDDKGHIDKARLGADIGKVRKPQPVRSRGMEDPVHMVAWTWHGLVLHCGADRLAANDAAKADVGHQPLDRATRDLEALAHHLPPNLPCAIDLEILREDALDLRLEPQIPFCPRRPFLWIGALGDVVAVGRPSTGSGGRSAAPCRSARPHGPRGDRR